MSEQETTLRQAVLDVLQEVAGDRTAPPAARVQAARTLAEMAGLIGRVQSSGLDVSSASETELGPDELDRELERVRKARAAQSAKSK
jgi:hypothetical protein